MLVHPSPIRDQAQSAREIELLRRRTQHVRPLTENLLQGPKFVTIPFYPRSVNHRWTVR